MNTIFILKLSYRGDEHGPSFRFVGGCLTFTGFPLGHGRVLPLTTGVRSVDNARILETQNRVNFNLLSDLNVSGLF